MVLLIFDTVKLALYTLFFGYRQITDIKTFLKLGIHAEPSDFFQLIWNGMVTFLNITNYIYFVLLSFGFDVNEILRQNEFVDSFSMQDMYSQA